MADYAVELLPELAKISRLRVIRPPDWTEPEDWPDGIETVATGCERRDDEIELLHLGNNPYHLWLLQRLRQGGAMVVLHDAVLHHLLVESTLDHDAAGELGRELERSHGSAGRALTAARVAGHHGRLDPFLFPARPSFLRHAAGVLVHSAWAAGEVASELPDMPVRELNLTVADPAPVDRAAVRSRLGLGDRETVLMHLGFLSRAKGLEEILGGFATAVRAGLNGRLVIAGAGIGGEVLRAAVDRLGLDERVGMTGYIEPEVFPGLPAAADLGVVLRTPSAGETSAATLRFLACGVPVAVGGRRQFLEWPERAAPRLTPGPAASAELARLLGEVGTAGWDQRRSAAREAYEAGHRPEQVAEQLVDALTDIPLCEGVGDEA